MIACREWAGGCKAGLCRSGRRCGEEQSLELPADPLIILRTTVPCHQTGKSSVLSVLLGELQPARQAGGAAQARPPVSVHGSVAYCSQVPWIVSGSLKVRKLEAVGRSDVLLRVALCCREDVRSVHCSSRQRLWGRCEANAAT